MAGYPYIGQVTDPNAQKALKAAMDLIASLTSRVAALEATAVRNSANLDANSQRIVSLASPASDTDAANAGYVKAYVSAQLESFKGIPGVTGAFDVTITPNLTLQDGIVTEIV